MTTTVHARLTSRPDRSAQGCREAGQPADRLARPVPDLPVFVIRAKDLGRLERLANAMPEPIGEVWINRGTGQHLRRQSVAMLLRTLAGGRTLSPSAERLRDNAGLQLIFASTDARNAFARAWKSAQSG